MNIRDSEHPRMFTEHVHGAIARGRANLNTGGPNSLPVFKSPEPSDPTEPDHGPGAPRAE